MHIKTQRGWQCLLPRVANNDNDTPNFRAGILARIRNLNYTDCPFDKWSDPYIDWIEGWLKEDSKYWPVTLNNKPK